MGPQDANTAASVQGSKMILPLVVS